MTAPIISDTPVRMPIRPPAAIITKSVSGRIGQLAQVGAARAAASSR